MTNLSTVGTLVSLLGIVIILVVSFSANAALVDINNRVAVRYTNATTTFTNIPGLSFALAPTTKYLFTVSVIYSGTTAQFAVGPLPAGTTFTICGVQYDVGSTIPQVGCTSTTGSRITYDNGINTPPQPAVYTGAVLTGAVAGTFNMQGSSLYGPGYPMFVEVNSWIEAQVSSV